MKTTICTTACLLTAFATSGAQAQNLEMQPHTIRDPMVGNRDAVTFLKPKGWMVSGGMKWYANLAHQACLEMKVTNPKGLEQVETLPYCNFTWITNPLIAMPRGFNYLGSIVEPVVDDPREIVRKFTIPNLRAKYKPRITGYKEMTDVAKALAFEGGKIKAGRVRIEYEIDGQAVEEDFYLVIYVVSVNLGINNSVSTNWGPAWTPFSLRAKKGELDAKTPLLMSVVNSGQVNQRWYSEWCYVKDLFMQRMANGIENAAKLSITISKNNDAIMKMYSDSYRLRQESQDRISRNFSNYIRGVENYHSPYSIYPVQLPNTHNYVWGSSNGTYVLSNNANFDPNLNSPGTWQLLKVAK